MLTVDSKWSKEDKESALQISRTLPDGLIQIVILGPNSQLVSFEIDPASFLQGIRSIYPELLIQLPAN